MHPKPARVNPPDEDGDETARIWVVGCRNLVPLVRKMPGDRLYSLTVARHIVNQRRGHCRDGDVLHAGGQETTAGERNPATGTSRDRHRGHGNRLAAEPLSARADSGP